MKSLHELFEDGIKDMYNAEKQLIKALPKMVKMSKDQRLKEGFENHLRQTHGHAQRIEQICQSINIKPTGMVCRAMLGLVEEASEHMQGLKPSSCTDAEVIALAQKIEHYEIGSYGTLVEWAKLMGHEEAANLLQQTLDEEKAADNLLNEIAYGEVNRLAAEESQQMNMGDGGVRRKTRTTRATSRGTTRSRTTTSRGKTRGTGRTKSRTARAATTNRSSTRSPSRSTASAKTSGRKSTARGKSTPRGRASMR